MSETNTANTMDTTENTPVTNPQEIPKEIPPVKEKSIEKSHGKDGQPKRSKKEDRHHKKEDKATEQFLKSLDSISSVDGKLAALTKRFCEVTEENRRLHAGVTQSNKQMAVVFKEKEGLQLEYNRTVLFKSKLENLCRELQKQNKTIKEESLLRIREEEERRKEAQGKFQSTLTEITTFLQQNKDKNNKLSEDNITMSTKLKGVVEKYELREQQVEKLSKQMELEHQLAEAKLAKCRLEAQADRERLNAEIAQLKLQIGQYQARMLESKSLEESLKSQLNVYTDKYDEFQSALVKSNQVFGGFKGEIEKMSKKITKLEKECASWKKRWETSQVALLEMATEKKICDDQAAVCDRQLAQLQRLCRSMQAERTLLLNTLKENNIERPPLPVLPPAPAPAPQPSQPNKVDAMAANCAQLKQSLAQLQNQLNVLTTQKEEENQNKTEQQTIKPKKTKVKKNKDKAQQGNVANQECTKQKDGQGTSNVIAQEETSNEKSAELDCKDDKKPIIGNKSDGTSILDVKSDLNEVKDDKDAEKLNQNTVQVNEPNKENIVSHENENGAKLSLNDNLAVREEKHDAVIESVKEIVNPVVNNEVAVSNDSQMIQTEETKLAS